SSSVPGSNSVFFVSFPIDKVWEMVCCGAEPVKSVARVLARVPQQTTESMKGCKITMQIALTDCPALSRERYNDKLVWRIRNVSITLRQLGEKFRLQEEARRPFPTAVAGG